MCLSIFPSINFWFSKCPAVIWMSWLEGYTIKQVII
jgi:hypothetical protein